MPKLAQYLLCSVWNEEISLIWKISTLNGKESTKVEFSPLSCKKTTILHSKLTLWKSCCFFFNSHMTNEIVIYFILYFLLISFILKSTGRLVSNPRFAWFIGTLIPIWAQKLQNVFWMYIKKSKNVQLPLKKFYLIPIGIFDKDCPSVRREDALINLHLFLLLLTTTLAGSNVVCCFLKLLSLLLDYWQCFSVFLSTLLSIDNF